MVGRQTRNRGRRKNLDQIFGFGAPSTFKIHQSSVLCSCTTKIEDMITFLIGHLDCSPDKQVIRSRTNKIFIDGQELSGHTILELEQKKSADGPSLFFDQKQ